MRFNLDLRLVGGGIERPAPLTTPSACASPSVNPGVLFRLFVLWRTRGRWLLFACASRPLLVRSTLCASTTSLPASRIAVSAATSAVTLALGQLMRVAIAVSCWM
ncbi:MAG: hypothetical protein M3Z22_00555 [Verrucomicrobiota bacterium]|nr:hypothetical protein [Verrucomicrobiota bacterium]